VLQLSKLAEGKHIYAGTHEGTDVRVAVNKDRKTWTATHGDHVIGDKFKSRAEAEAALNGHLGTDTQEATNPEAATPTQSTAGDGTDNAPKPGADGDPTRQERKQPTITTRDFKVLTIVQDNPSIQLQNVTREYGDALTAVAIIGSLGNRKLIEVDQTTNEVTLTDKGREAHAIYVDVQNNKVRQPREPKQPRTPKPAKSPEELAAIREEKLRLREEKFAAKFGPKAEGIGPKPTVVELAQARVENATASLNWALMDQRIHPFSPIAAKKVKSARERVQMAEEAKAKADEFVANGGHPYDYSLKVNAPKGKQATPENAPESTESAEATTEAHAEPTEAPAEG